MIADLVNRIGIPPPMRDKAGVRGEKGKGGKCKIRILHWDLIQRGWCSQNLRRESIDILASKEPSPVKETKKIKEGRGNKKKERGNCGKGKQGRKGRKGRSSGQVLGIVDTCDCCGNRDS